MKLALILNKTNLYLIYDLVYEKDWQALVKKNTVATQLMVNWYYQFDKPDFRKLAYLWICCIFITESKKYTEPKKINIVIEDETWKSLPRL